MARQIVAMVVIEIDETVLCPHMEHRVLREAVVAALPGLSRVMAVMGESEARLMIGAHQMAVTESGITNERDFIEAAVRVQLRRGTMH